MQPGLRRLPPGAPQLTPSSPDDAVFQAKLRVLREHAGQALLAVPGHDAGPALDRLCRHAAAEHPEAWQWDGAQASATRLGWGVRDDRPFALTSAAQAFAAAGAARAVASAGAGPSSTPAGSSLHEVGLCLNAAPPGWRLATLLALAFAEDFAIADAASGRIPWLAVCLPSHWAPEAKLGLPFAEVHAPVADNALIVKAADALMRLVTGEDRWERFVWTLTPQAALDAHPRRARRATWPADAGPEELAASAYFRTERQTFIPVPGQRQAIFTIGVALRPFAEAIDTPSRAAALHDALATMSDAVLDYRQLRGARGRLLDWLALRAAA